MIAEHQEQCPSAVAVTALPSLPRHLQDRDVTVVVFLIAITSLFFVDCCGAVENSAVNSGNVTDSTPYINLPLGSDRGTNFFKLRINWSSGNKEEHYFESHTAAASYAARQNLGNYVQHLDEDRARLIVWQLGAASYAAGAEANDAESSNREGSPHIDLAEVHSAKAHWNELRDRADSIQNDFGISRGEIEAAKRDSEHFPDSNGTSEWLEPDPKAIAALIHEKRERAREEQRAPTKAISDYADFPSGDLVSSGRFDIELAKHRYQKMKRTPTVSLTPPGPDGSVVTQSDIEWAKQENDYLDRMSDR